MKNPRVFTSAGNLDDKELMLLREAEGILGSAYSPYSGIRVAAALAASSGKVYRGVNVENASLGLSLCAERAAMVQAISSGERSFVLLAVVSPDVEDLVPCGSCLQFLAEFCEDLTILVKPSSGSVLKGKLSGLLPKPFAVKREK